MIYVVDDPAALRALVGGRVSARVVLVLQLEQHVGHLQFDRPIFTVRDRRSLHLLLELPTRKALTHSAVRGL
jgi:hypothetical protein